MASRRLIPTVLVFQLTFYYTGVQGLCYRRFLSVVQGLQLLSRGCLTKWAFQCTYPRDRHEDLSSKQVLGGWLGGFRD